MRRSASERDDAVCSAGGAVAKNERATPDSDVDLDRAGARVNISDSNCIAVGCRERQRCVFRGGQRRRSGYGRRIVDRRYLDSNRLSSRQRATGAGIALVVDRDRQAGGGGCGAVVRVQSRGELGAFQRSIDLRRGTSERHYTIGGVAARAVSQDQSTASYSYIDLDWAGARINVSDGDRVAVGCRERQRCVFRSSQRGRGVDGRRVVDRSHVYGDRLSGCQSTTCAGVALVVDRDGQIGRRGCGAVVGVQCRGELGAFQRSIDLPRGTSERNDTVCSAGSAVQQDQSTASNRHVNLDRAGARINVSDSDRIAVGCRERQRCVFRSSQRGRGVDGRRVVDRSHVYGDRLSGCQSTTCAGVALVVDRDGQIGRRGCGAVVGVQCRGELGAFQRSIDLPRGTSERNDTVCSAGSAVQQDQSTASNRHVNLDRAGARINVSDSDRIAVGCRERQRCVFRSSQRGRGVDGRRVVDRSHVYGDRLSGCQSTTCAGVALVVDRDGQIGRRGCGAVVRVQRRCECGAFKSSIDLRRGASQGHNAICSAGGAVKQNQSTASNRHVDLDWAGARVNISDSNCVAIGRRKRQRGVFGGSQRSRSVDSRRVVDRCDDQLDGLHIRGRGRAVAAFCGVRADSQLKVAVVV